MRRETIAPSALHHIMVRFNIYPESFKTPTLSIWFEEYALDFRLPRLDDIQITRQ
jgi:hypothetical protein